MSPTTLREGGGVSASHNMEGGVGEVVPGGVVAPAGDTRTAEVFP
jgi:hypothetical protein